jgi:hypothetical protein
MSTSCPTHIRLFWHSSLDIKPMKIRPLHSPEYHALFNEWHGAISQEDRELELFFRWSALSRWIRFSVPYFRTCQWQRHGSLGVWDWQFLKGKLFFVDVVGCLSRLNCIYGLWKLHIVFSVSQNTSTCSRCLIMACNILLTFHVTVMKCDWAYLRDMWMNYVIAFFFLGWYHVTSFVENLFCCWFSHVVPHTGKS